MPDFDQIDLINYAVYGNENDPEWDSIRNYVTSNPQAFQKMEDLKKGLVQASETQKQKIKEENFPTAESNLAKSTFANSRSTQLEKNVKKSWWRRLTGD